MIEEVNKLIDDYSKSIAQELSDIRFWEVEKIKATISTMVKLAMIDCLEIQTIGLEKQKFSLVKEYNTPGIATWKLERLKMQLIEINKKIKEANRLRWEFSQDTDYRNFRDWMRNNGHDDILNHYFTERGKSPSIRKEIKNNQP